MKIGLAVIIICLTAPYVASAQATVEERLDRIEQRLDRVEVKIDRLIAGYETKLQSAGGEIIREQHNQLQAFQSRCHTRDVTP